MKTLNALIARFTNEVFRIVRAATLEELAELLEARGERVARPRGPGRPLRSAGAPARAPARTTDEPRGEGSRRGHSAADLPAVAEITDPERLLRSVGAAAPPARHSPPARRRVVRRSSLLEDATTAAKASAAPATGDVALAATSAAQQNGNGAAVVDLHPEPKADAPGSAQPAGTVSVMLRANEALVRSSGAGIVIRRKRA